MITKREKKLERIREERGGVGDLKTRNSGSIVSFNYVVVNEGQTHSEDISVYLFYFGLFWGGRVRIEGKTTTIITMTATTDLVSRGSITPSSTPREEV